MPFCDNCGEWVDDEDSYDEGYHQGQLDCNSQGRDEGFEEGFRAAWVRAKELALGVVDDNDDLFGNLHTDLRAAMFAAFDDYEFRP